MLAFPQADDPGIWRLFVSSAYGCLAPPQMSANPFGQFITWNHDFFVSDPAHLPPEGNAVTVNGVTVPVGPYVGIELTAPG